MTDTLGLSKVVPRPGGERENSVKSVEKNLSRYPQLHLETCSCRAGLKVQIHSAAPLHSSNDTRGRKCTSGGDTPCCVFSGTPEHCGRPTHRAQVESLIQRRLRAPPVSDSSSSLD